jgi:hypothetical protein
MMTPLNPPMGVDDPLANFLPGGPRSSRFRTHTGGFVCPVASSSARARAAPPKPVSGSTASV